MKKTNVKNYTDKELLKKVKSLPNFKFIPSEYWILGVRSNEDAPDQFDDKFYLFKGEKCIMVLSGTTNAGVYGLKNFDKYNSKGCAVVKSDEWYYGLWTGGYHKGKMKALVQTGDIKYYRDNNRDTKIDETGTIYTGKIGINYHTVTYNTDPNILQKFWAKLIGAWSVGCQCPNEPTEYYKSLNYTWGQLRTTYCLIKEF